MKAKKFNLNNMLKAHKKGKKIILEAMHDHLPDELQGEPRIIKQGEEGRLIDIIDLDTPDYASRWGRELKVDWGDIKSRYVEYFLVNSFYIFDAQPELKTCPIIGGYGDFFHLKRIE